MNGFVFTRVGMPNRLFDVCVCHDVSGTPTPYSSKTKRLAHTWPDLFLAVCLSRSVAIVDVCVCMQRHHPSL